MELSLKDTIPSGQSFRFTQNGDEWTVIAGVGKDVKTITVTQDSVSTLEHDSFWNNYFDMSTDYEGLKREFSKISPIMKKACDYAPGIHILNQDSWEALCSFVVSQNNNIKRIMAIVDKMCTAFGPKCGSVYGFPEADVLAGASEESLRAVGLGFRAPYIINVSEAVCSKKVDLDALKICPIDEARKMLMNVQGIGPKVADCALLFGCHRLDCFPIDVWIKKVMLIYFEGCGPEIFGPYAGIAQQYLFHWARTSGELK